MSHLFSWVNQMDGSNCCDQDRILKVFNPYIFWKEVPQDDIRWIEEKVARDRKSTRLNSSH